MADKKLLEESVIARFQQLANIPKTSKGMLSEGRDFAGNGGTKSLKREFAGMAPKEESFMGHMREEEEMEAPEGDDAGMDPMAGDDMGAESEGGDLESAVSTVVDALNGLLDAAGLSDKKVEMDSGEEGGEDMEAPEGDMGADDMPMMESDDADADGAKKMEEAEDPEEDPEEELDESIELVDDTLIEKLVRRVSARLVAEARKSRELAEGKQGWGKQGMSKGKPAKAKGSPKGKPGTPFNKSVSTKGLAGRGK